MAISEKIGLLFWTRHFADKKFLATLFLCLTVTMLLPFLIGIIFESRLLPILPDRQSPTFMPGDIFLAIGACQGLILATKLPSGKFWYNSRICQILLFAAVVIGVIFMYRNELFLAGTSDVNFPREAILSPTKIYHDFVVVGLFGYIILSTYIALIFNVMIGVITLPDLFKAIWPILVWAAFLVTDSYWPYEWLVNRAQGGCHVPDWQPIWK